MLEHSSPAAVYLDIDHAHNRKAWTSPTQLALLAYFAPPAATGFDDDAARQSTESIGNRIFSPAQNRSAPPAAYFS
jgi:hypothetical protein